MADLDFKHLKREANGMCPEEVYRGIFETARHVKQGDIVEIGTAHGAATIALAHGYQTGKIHTIDKIKGGSRDQYGDFEDNIKIIRKNFAAFGVSDRIEFYAGASTEIAPKLPNPMQIGLLMLDADGAIDRDFRLFYDQILPGAPVIIDDYQPGFVRIYNRGKTIRIDQKRRLTALLVDYFVSQNYLSTKRVIDQTWFGVKPENASSITKINENDIRDLYRRLIFADGAAHGKTAELINGLTRQFPNLHKKLKKVYLKVSSPK